jgi:hypothetical protein
VLLVLVACASAGVVGIAYRAVTSGSDPARVPIASSPAVAPTGLAPRSQPASRVRISGGTAVERATLRRIVHGLGWTAIRSIAITPLTTRPAGSAFTYTIAVPDRSGASSAILGSQAGWEAAMVGESYAALARRMADLPRLTHQAFHAIDTRGDMIDGWGGVGTDYRGRLGSPLGQHAITIRVHRAARLARFQLQSLTFVHPYVTLPVIVLSTEDHRRLEQRLATFMGHVLDLHHPNLAYVRLDTTCGTPIFARGQGVATNPKWFDFCDFAAGCPAVAVSRRLTYPC